jgi:hypothetical protein
MEGARTPGGNHRGRWGGPPPGRTTAKARTGSGSTEHQSTAAAWGWEGTSTATAYGGGNLDGGSLWRAPRRQRPGDRDRLDNASIGLAAGAN